MRLASKLALSLGLLPSLASQPGALQEPSDDPPQQQTEPVVHMGRAFLFKADLETARASGWIAADMSDAEALEITRAALHQRLRRAGRFVEAQVLLEEGGQFAVVFVGRQDPLLEDFIVAGITEPGRVACRIAATDGDFAGELGGSNLAAERARLEAWCQANPDVPLSTFHTVAREKGGPLAGLEWLAPRGAQDRLEAMAFLREPHITITRHGAEQLYADPYPVEEGKERTYSLLFSLQEEFDQELKAFYQEHAGRDLQVVIDEWVVAPMTEPGEKRFRVAAEFSMRSLRAIVFATMGEVVPVRLEFLGYDKRPLAHVKPG